MKAPAACIVRYISVVLANGRSASPPNYGLFVLLCARSRVENPGMQREGASPAATTSRQYHARDDKVADSGWPIDLAVLSWAVRWSGWHRSNRLRPSSHQLAGQATRDTCRRLPGGAAGAVGRGPGAGPRPARAAGPRSARLRSVCRCPRRAAGRPAPGPGPTLRASGRAGSIPSQPGRGARAGRAKTPPCAKPARCRR